MLGTTTIDPRGYEKGRKRGQGKRKREKGVKSPVFQTHGVNLLLFNQQLNTGDLTPGFKNTGDLTPGLMATGYIDR